MSSTAQGASTAELDVNFCISAGTIITWAEGSVYVMDMVGVTDNSESIGKSLDIVYTVYNGFGF